MVTLRFNKEKMVIVGNHKKPKDKIIEIPKEEAFAFIECECEGRLEGIFDRLSYDGQEDVLYLIGKDGASGLETIQ